MAPFRFKRPRVSHPHRLSPEGRERLSLLLPFLERDEATLSPEDRAEIRELLRFQSPGRIAELIGAAPLQLRLPFFRILPPREGPPVLSHLDEVTFHLLLRELERDELRDLVGALFPDDRTALISALPDHSVAHILELLSPEDLEETRSLLAYPQESVGRLMTTRPVTLRREWTVLEALLYVRSQATTSETVNFLYVTDTEDRMQGVVELKELVLGADETTVEGLPWRRQPRLHPETDREEAVRVMREWDVHVLPVVDREDHLLGIVTADDLFDVAEQEFTEDFHKMGTVRGLTGPFRRSSVRSLWGARVGWLLILVFMNLLSGAGIAFFEDTLAATLSLAFFLPLLIGSGGNAGAQASTLMVRALATGEIRGTDWLRLLRRELLVSLLLGIPMAVGVALIAGFRAPEVVPVVAATMVLVVIVGSVVGMSLPFVLTRMGFDPAAASAPLVTSLADISGVVIYFSIASRLLGG